MRDCVVLLLLIVALQQSDLTLNACSLAIMEKVDNKSSLNIVLHSMLSVHSGVLSPIATLQITVFGYCFTLQ